MNKKTFTPILIAILFKSIPVFAQKKITAWQFIEPNISIGYDSNVFKMRDRFSNSVYETESYAAGLKHDAGDQVYFYISAHQPNAEFTGAASIDSMMMANYDRAKQLEDDSIKIISMDKTVRHVQGFSCIGMIINNVQAKETASIIICNHASPNDMTQIKYTSKNHNSLDADYGIIDELLRGFRSYSKAEIEKDENDLRQKYTVTVTARTDSSDHFRWSKLTYAGTVKINQPLQHAIIEARLSIGTGEQIFYPNEKNEMFIACKDEKKGVVEKNGSVIILNSFGRKVKIPFAFTYFNK